MPTPFFESLKKELEVLLPGKEIKIKNVRTPAGSIETAVFVDKTSYYIDRIVPCGFNAKKAAILLTKQYPLNKLTNLQS